MVILVSLDIGISLHCAECWFKGRTKMKKALVIGLALLFFGVSGVVGFQTNSSPEPLTRGWLYVGGSGPGNYTRIQDAVDNASNGDTVFVYSGNYQQGMIIVNKTINLRGEEKNTTIIDGCGQTCIFRLVNSDFYTLFIEINGFTIQNASAGIEIFSHNNTISGNIIQNNVYGIVIGWASNNLIYGNVIRKNSFGIFTLGNHVWNNIIERNIIEDNSYGLDIKEVADHTLIHYNNIINNSIYGIVINCCYNTVVEKNNIFGNHQNANFVIFFEIDGFSKITWNRNYWGTSHLLPKIIQGKLEVYALFQPMPPADPLYVYYNWLKFDRHPALKPYDIGR
jgi:parallel beta-helix repeat protein